MRAGNVNQLDGSASFTQALAGGSITCFWQNLSGPSAPIFSSNAACQPTLTGLVFGDYLMQLTVTDAAGLTAVSTVDIGAVGTDSNMVVVQANPDADAIYGPMMAWGWSP